MSDGSTGQMFYHLECVNDIDLRKKAKSNAPVPAMKQQIQVVRKKNDKKK